MTEIGRYLHKIGMVRRIVLSKIYIKMRKNPVPQTTDYTDEHLRIQQPSIQRDIDRTVGQQKILQLG